MNPNFQVKHEILTDGSTIDKTDTPPEVEEPPTLENSIGSKMMKTMGWKGGGLGKSEQGLIEPVK